MTDKDIRILCLLHPLSFNIVLNNKKREVENLKRLNITLNKISKVILNLYIFSNKNWISY